VFFRQLKSGSRRADTRLRRLQGCKENRCDSYSRVCCWWDLVAETTTHQGLVMVAQLPAAVRDRPVSLARLQRAAAVAEKALQA
jgi:hypothetical protein